MLAFFESQVFIELAGAAVAATSVYTLWRRVLKPVMSGLRSLNEKAHLLVEISDQLKPNGGSTLMDQVQANAAMGIRVEAKLSEIESTLATHDERTAQLAIQVANITQQLERRLT